MFNDTLQKILSGNSLSFSEAQDAMEEIMSGKVSDIKLSSWLTALKLKGETADEIGGCASVMNRYSTKVACEDPDVVDIVGTGGDGAKTFNVSTTAAFVIAGAGITVAKHGNRAVSSKSGSADVLTELGINISITPEIMEKCLKEVGMSFLFAQMLHPAMKYAMPVRKELGTRTIFNILGPLCNPANTQRMTIGVYSKHLCRLIADAALKLNKKHILVVYGNDSLDEISTTTTTHICEVIDGEVREYELSPKEAGIKLAESADLEGGTPEENAKIVVGILDGSITGSKRDIVVLNAASSIIVSDITSDWKEAVKIAEQSIDSGKALSVLENLKICSQ